MLVGLKLLDIFCLLVDHILLLILLIEISKDLKQVQSFNNLHNDIVNREFTFLLKFANSSSFILQLLKITVTADLEGVEVHRFLIVSSISNISLSWCWLLGNERLLSLRLNGQRVDSLTFFLPKGSKIRARHFQWRVCCYFCISTEKLVQI